MAESSILWTTGTTGDGATPYTEAQVRQWMMDTFGGSHCVLYGIGNSFNYPAPYTSIQDGSAYVRGLFYRSTASINHGMTTPVVGSTGWIAVIEADWITKTVRLKFVRNTDGVAAIPTLTQTDGTKWQMPLWSGVISTGGVISGVADLRPFAHYPHKLAAGDVSAADIIVDDVISDNHILNRVPVLTKRRGANNQRWWDGYVGNGYYEFTVTQIKQFVVSVDVTVPAGQKSTSVILSSPEPYYNGREPILMVSVIDNVASATQGIVATAAVNYVTNSSNQIVVTRGDPSNTAATYPVTLMCLFIGDGGV